MSDEKLNLDCHFLAAKGFKDPSCPRLVDTAADNTALRARAQELEAAIRVFCGADTCKGECVYCPLYPYRGGE